MYSCFTELLAAFKYSLLAFLLFGTFLFVLRPLYILYVFYRQKNIKIPNGYLPIFGHYFELRKNNYAGVRDLYEQNNGIVPFCEGFRTFVYIGDPKIVAEIMSKCSQNYHPATRASYKALGSSASISLTDPLQQDSNQRKSIVTQAFSKVYQKVKTNEFFDAIFGMYEMERQNIDQNLECFNIGRLMEELSLKIGTLIVFGPNIVLTRVEFYNENGGLVSGTFYELCSNVCSAYAARSIKRRNFLGIFEELPLTKSDKILNSNMTKFLDFLKKLVLQRGDAINSNTVTDLTGLLKHEFQQRKIEINQEQLVSYISLAYISLLPTIPALVCNTLFNIGEDIRIQCEMRAEVLSQAILSPETINNLEYTSCCLSETLRLCAPLVQLSSIKLQNEIEVNGIKLDTSSIITIDAHYIQSRKQAWFEPNNYIPDRFIPKHQYYGRADGARKRHDLDFQPFFTGTRKCAGQSLSMLLGKLLTAMIIRDYIVLPSLDQKDKPYRYEYNFPNIRLAKRQSFSIS